MANTGGSWLVIQQMLEDGDPRFVDEVRASFDADRLARFATTWYQDRRPAARRFLLEYLKRPLNAYRHEPLVKRLFKLAEKNRDDEVMAHFLVALDRSVRRQHARRARWQRRTVADRARAKELIQQWKDEGAEWTQIDEWGGKFHVSASIQRDRLFVPAGTTMPRGKGIRLNDPIFKMLETLRLFSVHTRNYLRRRVWRYFRRLAKERSESYVPIIVQALKLYQDADADDGVALLDNWSLLHILFHHSPVLKAKNNGWTVVRGRGLNELAPAPIYPDLWKSVPQFFFELLKETGCRVIRQWVLFYLRQNPGLLRNAAFEDLFRMLNHEDAEIAMLAADALATHPEMSRISVERWLNLLQSVTANALDAVCRLASQHVRSAQVPLDALLTLACSRALPIARLGFRWLQERTLLASDLQQLWLLTEAQAKALRPELVRWARRKLQAAADFRSTWVLDFLDSRHVEVRAEGWGWLLDEPRARDDITIWQKLFESPYDDVRLRLVDYLQKRYDTKNALRSKQSALDPEMLRLVWASVLLNIHRGGRGKPAVVQQVVQRMLERPGEGAVWLPLLKVALRSIRGPEWRAGLAGIVQLLERRPEMKAVVKAQIPELQMV